MLEMDVLEDTPGVRFDDVAGLSEAKRLLEEAVVLPLLMPEYFQNQSRALLGHPLDKRSTPRVTRVHHEFRRKPGNPPARRHGSRITGKTRLAQGSNRGFPGSPIIAHQCLTLHQVGVEPASLKRNASPPPLDLEIIGCFSDPFVP
ncbi:putative microtubule-severing ATPase [Helianthus annuus]|nr:putative microtubule-severing ATPase [Helianthus annuus]